MSNQMNSNFIISNLEIDDFYNSIGSHAAPIECIDLKNGKSLITIASLSEGDKTMIDQDISISVAAAVTAYARIFMDDFLADPDFIIYYTDTDSIYTNKPLPAHLVNNKLGGWKLENL